MRVDLCVKEDGGVFSSDPYKYDDEAVRDDDVLVLETFYGWQAHRYDPINEGCPACNYNYFGALKNLCNECLDTFIRDIIYSGYEDRGEILRMVKDAKNFIDAAKAREKELALNLYSVTTMADELEVSKNTIQHNIEELGLRAAGWVDSELMYGKAAFNALRRYLCEAED